MKIIVIGASHGGREVIDGLLQGQMDETTVDWIDAAPFGPIMGSNDAEVEKEKADLLAKHVTVFDQTTMVGLDVDQHQVTLQNADQTTWNDSYDKLVLALGARAITLPVPGHDLENILAVSHRQELITLRRLAPDESIKNVVVIGAGYIGMNMAEMFNQAGKQVTVVNGSDRPFSGNLDAEFTDVLTDAIDETGIKLQMNEQLVSFTGENGTVESVVTDKDEYDADLVVEAIGNRPATAVVADALKLDDHGLIQTDDLQQTSDPDVYAVGDATTVAFAPTGTKHRVPLASAASHIGYQLGRHLAGDMTPIQGVSGTSVLTCGDYVFGSTGVNNALAASCDVTIDSVYVMQNKLMDQVPANRNQHLAFKLFYAPETGRVMGAQVMAKSDVTEMINTVSLGISLGVTVQQLANADFFFQPEFSRPQNIVNVAARKAMQQMN